MGFQIAELYADLGVKDAQYMTAMKRAEQYALRLKVGLQSVSRVAKRVFLGLAAFAGVALYAFAKQERAERLLDAALRASGQSVAQYSRQLRALSSEFQRLTILGDEEVLTAMTLATNYGATADNMRKIIQQAIGITALRGGTVQLAEAVRYAMFASAGLFGELGQAMPMLTSVKTAEEKLALYTKLVAQGWALAQEEAQTFGGSLKQIKNMLGDVAEELGRGLLPYIIKLRDEIKRLLPAFISWIKEKKEVIAQTALFIGKLALYGIVIPKAITLIIGLATAFQMLGAAIGFVVAAKTGAMLGGPIGGIVGALVGVGGVIWAIRAAQLEWRRFREELEKRVEPKIETAGLASAGIREQISSIRGQMQHDRARQELYRSEIKQITANLKHFGPTMGETEEGRQRKGLWSAKLRGLEKGLPLIGYELEKLASKLRYLTRDFASTRFREMAGGLSTFLKKHVVGTLLAPLGLRPRAPAAGEKREREGPQFLSPEMLWRVLQESMFGQGRVEEQIEKNTKDSAETLDEIAGILPSLKQGPVLT